MKHFNSFIFAAVLAVFAPLAFASAELAPMSVDGAITIDAAKAKQMWDKGVTFVDVRPDKDWNAGRIPGAVHLDLDKHLTEESLGKEVSKDQPLVMYCNGIKCKRSADACAKAVAWGFTKVHFFRGGMPDWKTTGNPVE